MPKEALRTTLQELQIELEDFMRRRSKIELVLRREGIVSASVCGKPVIFCSRTMLSRA
jgi:hypothetical protein